MSQTIKITWKAFGNDPESNRYISSVEFELNAYSTIDQEILCEELFDNTNSYRGSLWQIIEPLLSPTRTHTALSVGDEIQIDDNTYEVANVGFKLLAVEV
jgi:hypothetical protein